PRRDELSNVVSRVRQFASDLLEAKGIHWDFEVSPELEKIRLDPEQRRHLLLIFKEALHNVVRHADCHKARLSLTVANGRLRAEIYDDGRSFIPAGVSQNGHGLENMRGRAAQLGGEISIVSAPDAGSHVTLTIPLRRR